MYCQWALRIYNRLRPAVEYGLRMRLGLRRCHYRPDALRMYIERILGVNICLQVEKYCEQTGERAEDGCYYLRVMQVATDPTTSALINHDELWRGVIRDEPIEVIILS
ncbi:hypothetical protein OROMI_030395 [Orobanche minor]